MTYRKNIKAGKKSRIKGPQIEEEVYNALLGDDFMQKIVEENNLSDAAIATLYQISCAPDDKIAELLFCYVKPLNFLLHPSAHFGPDLFGFLSKLLLSYKNVLLIVLQKQRLELMFVWQFQYQFKMNQTKTSFRKMWQRQIQRTST